MEYWYIGVGPANTYPQTKLYRTANTVSKHLVHYKYIASFDWMPINGAASPAPTLWSNSLMHNDDIFTRTEAHLVYVGVCGIAEINGSYIMDSEKRDGVATSNKKLYNGTMGQKVLHLASKFCWKDDVVHK
jgi:hypothetical protein